MKKSFLLSLISSMVLFGCQSIMPIPSELLQPGPTVTPSGGSKQVTTATLPLIERWKWSGMMPGLEYPPLVVVTEEKVAIVAQDGGGSKVMTFDAHTGHLIWQSDYINHLHNVDVSEDHIYVGTIQYVQAFELETGQVLWQGAKQPQNKKGFLDVYATDEQVQVYDFDQERLYLLDPQTGETLEELDYPQIFFKKGDTYYSGCRYGYKTSCLEAVSTITNKILWSYRFKGLVHLWPIFIEEDQIMLINSGGQLFAIDNITGRIIWQSQGLHFVTGPAKQDNLIYTIRSDATIVAFEPETGEEVGTIEMTPNRTIEDDEGNVLHYAIATSDKFVAAYYGNSQELFVFEKVDNTNGSEH